jgi:hypothetical protein
VHFVQKSSQISLAPLFVRYCTVDRLLEVLLVEMAGDFCLEGMAGKQNKELYSF